MEDYIVRAEQEVAAVRMHKPHVVILGAGASRACCPAGDKNGKQLPVMADFAKRIGLEELLSSWGIDPNQNFEYIFSGLYESGEHEKTQHVEMLIHSYFSQLELPDNPTIYDHLVLSLQETDIIATFNWDPFLIQAYQRNSRKGLKLPKLLFLHGNVKAGYCKSDEVRGVVGQRCKKCGEPYTASSLLYPILKKNYAVNFFISSEWDCLKWALKHAFMITIFGYSGPKADEEAISVMKNAWGDTRQRFMEQTAFISLQTEDEIRAAWNQFIHTHHYEVHDDFYNSLIAKYPRRTFDFFSEVIMKGSWNFLQVDESPIPKHLDFPDLWKWYEQFKPAEDIKIQES